MEKKTKIALAAIGAASAAAVTAAVTAYGARLIGSVAVDREIADFPDSIKNRLTGGLLDDPKLIDTAIASEQAEHLPTEKISTQSDDGLTLCGSLYTADNPKRIVIAMHGWRSTWTTDFGASVNFFHDCGCHIIYPDQRGTGDSDGDYIGFGVLERKDCLCWIKYAIARFGTELPIYLAGVSMGATTVLMTLGFTLPPSVRGVIADCGFTSPKAIWSHVASENLGVSDKLAYPIVNRIISKKAQFDGESYSSASALSENDRPVLFIHGGADTFVPIEMTFENYLACKAQKELLVVPGAGHGMSFVTDPAAYKKSVRAFFKKYDA